MKDNISVSISGDVIIIQIVRDGEVMQYTMNVHEAVSFRNILTRVIEEA
tara:strand:- start:46164 stop:46310 length:147 start_codon:yes stop_codon:yes gene_type:complete